MAILENHRVVGNGILVNAATSPSTKWTGEGGGGLFLQVVNDAFLYPYHWTCGANAKDSHSNQAAADSQMEYK
jgi:hypothetical protein